MKCSVCKQNLEQHTLEEMQKCELIQKLAGGV